MDCQLLLGCQTVMLLVMVLVIVVVVVVVVVMVAAVVALVVVLVLMLVLVLVGPPRGVSSSLICCVGPSTTRSETCARWQSPGLGPAFARSQGLALAQGQGLQKAPP